MRIVVVISLVAAVGACVERRAADTSGAYSPVAASIVQHPSVLAAEERVTQSSARAAGIRAAMFPTINVTGSYVDSNNDNSTTSSTTTASDPEKTVGFRAAMPLFRGFSNLNATRGALADVQAAQQSYLYTRDETVVRLVTAIAEVARDQQTVKIRQTELSDLNKFLAEARNRRNAGAASETDLHQIRTRLATARSELARANAAFQSSQAKRTSLEHEARLGPMAIMETEDFLPATLEEAVEAAIANNAILQELTWKKEAARRNVQVAQGAFLPSVDMSVTGEHDPDEIVTTGSTADQYDLEFRIDVNFPLFDGGARVAETRQTRSAYRESDYAYLAARRDLIAAVQSDWARAQAAGEITRFAVIRVEAARDAFKGVREGRPNWHSQCA